MKQGLFCTPGVKKKKEKWHSYQQVNESLGKGNEGNAVPVMIPIFMEMETLSIHVCFQDSH